MVVDQFYGLTDAVMGDTSSVAGHQWTAAHWFCGVVSIGTFTMATLFLALLGRGRRCISIGLPLLHSYVTEVPSNMGLSKD